MALWSEQDEERGQRPTPSMKPASGLERERSYEMNRPEIRCSRRPRLITGAGGRSLPKPAP